MGVFKVKNLAKCAISWLYLLKKGNFYSKERFFHFFCNDFHSSTITVDLLKLKLFVKTAMSQNLSLSKHPVIYIFYLLSVCANISLMVIHVKIKNTEWYLTNILIFSYYITKYIICYHYLLRYTFFSLCNMCLKITMYI